MNKNKCHQYRSSERLWKKEILKVVKRSKERLEEREWRGWKDGIRELKNEEYNKEQRDLAVREKICFPLPFFYIFKKKFFIFKLSNLTIPLET